VNVSRIKIVVFWLLFLGLAALLYYSWSHRILWLLLFLSAEAIAGFIGPRVSYPRDRAKMMMTLSAVAGVVFLFAFIVHGFLFPQSTGLTLAMQILMPLALLPALCYKAHSDYLSFRASRGRGAQQIGSTERRDRSSVDNETPLARRR
jgi:hypothetical protein